MGGKGACATRHSNAFPYLVILTCYDQARDVQEHTTGKAIEAHKVTTENVDQFNWSQDVTFYI